MEISTVVKLFREARRKNDWGTSSYLVIYDDGSGELNFGEGEYKGDCVFEFYNTNELVDRLEKSLK